MATRRKKEPASSPATRSKKTNRTTTTVGNGSAPLPPKLLQRLYYYMLKCRLVEERSRLLFRQRKFAGNYCPALGQEATQVGATMDLKPDDSIAPSHRHLVTNIMKGTPLKDLYAQLCGNKDSYSHFSSKVITPPSTMAAQLNIATGVALANRLLNKSNIVVALSGDGTTDLSSWHETLNFAGVHRLPIVYVLESDFGAESVATRRQTAAEDLSAKAQACGFPGITVDGNDVVAVYRVCHEARERARQGGGPTLVECKTYAAHGHPEITQAKHRSTNTLEESNAGDPILLMECCLRKHGLWSDDWKQQQSASIIAEIDEAIKFAQTARHRFRDLPEANA